MEKFFEERKKWVRDFLDSYLLSKRMEEVSGFDEKQNQAVPEDFSLSPVKPFDDNLETGQIRLLHGTERITYVVLLRRWLTDSFVVAPFSEYAYPATDEELKTEYNGGLFQQVLQIWNIRTLQDETLKQSWIVATLPQNDLDDAWQLWQATLGETILDDRILKKTSLPIYRADDPRLEYKKNALQNFAKIDAEDLALLDAAPTFFLGGYAAESSKLTFTPTGNQSLALAAGDQMPNILFDFLIPEKNIVCHLDFSPNDGKLRCNVRTDKGRRSSEMDGFQLQDKSTGKLIGCIAEGGLTAVFELTAHSTLQFLDANGTPVPGRFEDSED